MNKHFITTSQLQLDSFKLGEKIIKDDFKPDYLIALWRGGTSIAMYVHELLKYVYCIYIDHIAIRTSRYTGIDETLHEVQVHNLGYLLERLKKSDKILLVDDIWDTGLSIKAVIDTLHHKLGNNTPNDIRVATVNYKPLRNKTTMKPHYFVNETNEWIVFSHELEGCTLDEIKQNWGIDIYNIVNHSLALQNV